MKFINFIQALPPTQHKELVRWLRVSVMSSFCVLIAILILQGQQLYTFYSLKREHQKLQTKLALSSTAAQEQTLKKQTELFKERCAKLDRCVHNKQHPGSYLNTLQQKLGTAGTLESLTIKDKAVAMTVYCLPTTSISALLQTLEGSGIFQSLNLASLNQCKEKIKLTLKGALK